MALHTAALALYNAGLSMPFKEKDWKIFFKIYWRAIEGTYAFFGDVMYEGFAERYDELGSWFWT